MKKAIITGGTGFIGYHLVNELVKNNVEVYAVCSEKSANISRISKIDNVNIIYCDLENIEALSNICSQRSFDVFYHLAWKGASGPLRQDYATQVNNIMWTCNVARVAERLGCGKLVVTGTVCENQCDAINKIEGFSRSSYYLNAKKTAYSFIRNICKNSGLPLTWITFYHPVGIYNKKEQLIINTINNMISGNPLRFGKCQRLFDVIAVEDLSRGLFLAGEKNLSNDKYFIGSGEPRKLMDYIEEMRVLLSPEELIQYGTYPDDDLPMEEKWLDITPFKNETGYLPKYSFQEIVMSAKEWLISERNKELL